MFREILVNSDERWDAAAVFKFVADHSSQAQRGDHDDIEIFCGTNRAIQNGEPVSKEQRLISMQVRSDVAFVDFWNFCVGQCEK